MTLEIWGLYELKETIEGLRLTKIACLMMDIVSC